MQSATLLVTWPRTWSTYTRLRNTFESSNERERPFTLLRRSELESGASGDETDSESDAPVRKKKHRPQLSGKSYAKPTLPKPSTAMPMPIPIPSASHRFSSPPAAAGGDTPASSSTTSSADPGINAVCSSFSHHPGVDHTFRHRDNVSSCPVSGPRCLPPPLLQQY